MNKGVSSRTINASPPLYYTVGSWFIGSHVRYRPTYIKLPQLSIEMCWIGVWDCVNEIGLNI